MKQCNHTLGFIENNGYDGDIITEFVHLDFYELSTAKKLKSSGDGTIFSFCPYCGQNLEGMVDKRVSELELAIQQRKEEERLENEKRQKAFDKKVNEMAQKTGLVNLPEEGTFIVICEPINSYDKRDFVLVGPKSHLLNSSVTCIRNSSVEQITVKQILKAFSQEVFLKIMKDNGWEVKESGMCLKIINNKLSQVSHEGGIVYVNEKEKDDDYSGTKYDRFAVHRLGDYLGIEIELESINLTR